MLAYNRIKINNLNFASELRWNFDGRRMPVEGTIWLDCFAGINIGERWLLSTFSYMMYKEKQNAAGASL